MNQMPTDCSVDVVVLGGGPAGMAVARTVALGGRSVAVVERSHLELQRIGETVPPDIVILLTELGLWERFLTEGHLPSPGTRSIWGGSELYDNDFILNPFGNGWHLDRHGFDAMLSLAAEEAGVQVFRSTRAGQCTQDAVGHWSVQCITGCGLFVVYASILVDATGRSAAPTRRSGGHRIDMDWLIGITATFIPKNSGQIEDRRTLVEAIELGWWYSSLVPGNRIIVAYMTDSDLLPKGSGKLPAHFVEMLGRANHTKARVECCHCEPRLRVVKSFSSCTVRVPARNWVVAGDAAASLDPLSSQGIFWALLSGLRAASAIEDAFEGRWFRLDEYLRWVQLTFDSYLETRTEFYSRERRWPKSAFWTRRQTRGAVDQYHRIP